MMHIHSFVVHAKLLEYKCSMESEGQETNRTFVLEATELLDLVSNITAESIDDEVWCGVWWRW